MRRVLIAAALALHGLIHLIGFVVPFRIVAVEGFAYTTSAAWGLLDLGDDGAHVLGVLWLLGTAVFLVAAYGVGRSADWAIRLTAAAAGFSLVLCVLGSPAAVAGAGIDVVILGVIAYLQRVGRAAATVS